MTHHARWVLVPTVETPSDDPTQPPQVEPKYRDTDGIDAGSETLLARADAHAVTPGIDRGGPMTTRVFVARFVGEGRAGERALTSIVRATDTHALGASERAIAALLGRAVPEHAGRSFDEWDRGFASGRGPVSGVPSDPPPDGGGRDPPDGTPGSGGSPGRS